MDDINDALTEEFPDVTISLWGLAKHREKCALTLKRAMKYLERRNDPNVRAQRQEFVQDKILSGRVDYAMNCVFIDEASLILTCIARLLALKKVSRPES